MKSVNHPFLSLGLISLTLKGWGREAVSFSGGWLMVDLLLLFKLYKYGSLSSLVHAATVVGACIGVAAISFLACLCFGSLELAGQSVAVITWSGVRQGGQVSQDKSCEQMEAWSAVDAALTLVLIKRSGPTTNTSRRHATHQHRPQSAPSEALKSSWTL